LLADLSDAVNHDWPTARGFCLVVPITVGCHDSEILLTGKLHRIACHVRVDAILLACIVATNTRQTFSRRRCAAWFLIKKLGIPSGPLRLIKIVDGEVLCRINARVGGCCLGLYCDEANPETIGQCVESKACSTFGQTHACAVIGIPVGKILALITSTRAGIGADRDACPGATASGW
jgi:hypothetical protein